MQQKTRLWVITAACLAVTVLRCAELYFLTDPATGFFSAPGVWPWALCTGSIAAAPVLGLVVKMGVPKGARLLPSGGWLLPAAAWVAALVLTYDLYALVAAGSMTSAQGVFTALAVVFFMCCGTFYGQNKAMPMLTRFFALPLAVFRLLAEFLSTKGMAITAEHIYDLFLRCFMLVAYVALAKVMCEIELPKNIRNLVGWGTALILVAVLCTLPAYIISIFGGVGSVHGGSLPMLSDLFMGIFPLLYGLKMLSVRQTSAQQSLPDDTAHPASEQAPAEAPPEDPTVIQE